MPVFQVALLVLVKQNETGRGVSLWEHDSASLSLSLPEHSACRSPARNSVPRTPSPRAEGSRNEENRGATVALSPYRVRQGEQGRIARLEVVFNRHRLAGRTSDTALRRVHTHGAPGTPHPPPQPSATSHMIARRVQLLVPPPEAPYPLRGLKSRCIPTHPHFIALTSTSF